MMHRKVALFGPAIFASLVALDVSSCASGGGKDESPPPSLSLTVRPTRESIQKNLVDKRCIGCHQSASALNRHVELADISKLIDDGSHHHTPGEPRHGLIKPGCPKQSFFYSIMKTVKMPPPPAEKASPETLKAVEDWIVSLKPDAGPTCESDEPQDGPGGGGSDEPGA